MTRSLVFYLNSVRTEVHVECFYTLLEVLQRAMNRRNRKCGCFKGYCGTCTIIIEGRAVKPCLILAMSVENKRVLTVEGICIASHPIQKAFTRYVETECDFCRPGILMVAMAYLDKNHDPSENEVRAALMGNRCDCGSRPQYVKAILAAVDGEFGEIPPLELYLGKPR